MPEIESIKPNITLEAPEITRYADNQIRRESTLGSIQELKTYSTNIKDGGGVKDIIFDFTSGASINESRVSELVTNDQLEATPPGGVKVVRVPEGNMVYSKGLTPKEAVELLKRRVSEGRLDYFDTLAIMDRRFGGPDVLLNNGSNEIDTTEAYFKTSRSRVKNSGLNLEVGDNFEDELESRAKEIVGWCNGGKVGEIPIPSDYDARYDKKSGTLTIYNRKNKSNDGIGNAVRLEIKISNSVSASGGNKISKIELVTGNGEQRKGFVFAKDNKTQAEMVLPFLRKSIGVKETANVNVSENLDLTRNPNLNILNSNLVRKYAELQSTQSYNSPELKDIRQITDKIRLGNISEQDITRAKQILGDIESRNIEPTITANPEPRNDPVEVQINPVLQSVVNQLEKQEQLIAKILEKLNQTSEDKDIMSRNKKLEELLNSNLGLEKMVKSLELRLASLENKRAQKRDDDEKDSQDPNPATKKTPPTNDGSIIHNSAVKTKTKKTDEQTGVELEAAKVVEEYESESNTTKRTEDLRQRTQNTLQHLEGNGIPDKNTIERLTQIISLSQNGKMDAETIIAANRYIDTLENNSKQ